MRAMAREQQMPRSVWREPEDAEISDSSSSCQSAPYCIPPGWDLYMLVPAPAGCVQTYFGSKRTDHTIRLTFFPVYFAYV